MTWEYLLRMLRIHKVPMPDDQPDAELKQARQEVEKLHRKAEGVLEQYAHADRVRRGK